tara:strand:- start:1000 stop:1296 length:297 start_codon:yes stop_codon:yes gene_type:complete
MKYCNVIKISALGTRGKAKGLTFTAEQDRLGRYVLNKKTATPSQGNRTNRAENKSYAESLTEAANMLATDDYLINLVCPDGKRALRKFGTVIIDVAPS